MRRLVLYFFAIAAIVACKDDDEDTTVYISLAAETVEVTNVAQTGQITIKSDYNIAWEFNLEETCTWVELSETSGDSTTVVYLYFEANIDLVDRETEAYLTYTLDGVNEIDTLQIIQTGEDSQINITEEIVYAPSDAGLVTVGFTSNLPWRTTESPSWAEIIDTRVLDTLTMSIWVEKNDSYAYRTGTFSFAQDADTIVNSFTLLQFGKGDLETDSLALVTLYNETDGSNWVNTWDLSQPVDSWYGVTVEETIQGSRVTKLSLPNNNLVGEFPDDIFNIVFMKNLILNDNQLSGDIPETISQMNKILYVYLHNNNFEGELPTNMCNLDTLSRFYVHNNNLSGTIPEEIGNLTYLQCLGLSDNNFTGTLPEGIGYLEDLEVLSVSQNQLTGSIPDSYLENEYWMSWNPFENICPQQDGYSLSNCELDDPLKD